MRNTKFIKFSYDGWNPICKEWVYRVYIYEKSSSGSGYYHSSMSKSTAIKKLKEYIEDAELSHDYEEICVWREILKEVREYEEVPKIVSVSFDDKKESE